MKKIRSLFLGIVTLVFIFGFANKSEAVTPDIQFVTLKNGETVTFEKYGFASENFASSVLFVVTTAADDTVSSYKGETFSIKISAPSIADREQFIFGTESSLSLNFNEYTEELSPIITPKPFYFSLTNYSAGEVTYKVGINMATNIGTPYLYHYLSDYGMWDPF